MSISFLNKLRNISSVMILGNYILHLDNIKSEANSLLPSIILLYYYILYLCNEPYLVDILADLTNIPTTHIINSVNVTGPLLSTFLTNNIKLPIVINDIGN